MSILDMDFDRLPKAKYEASSTELDKIERAAKERAEIVAKYDKGREEGAQIDKWEDPEFEVYHKTDRYGFIHDQRIVSDRSTKPSKDLEFERTSKWVKMIKTWDKYYPGEKKMKNSARACSTSIHQIDLDVNRTYRNHIMFRQRYCVKQQHLFHVLAAYSVYNTEVGYCQGMSEIAAILLMYLDEEDAFWAMSQLFVTEQHSMHAGVRFSYYVEQERNEINTTFYTIKWFLQCFMDRTPFHLTLRLWDIYILEGDRLLVAMAYTAMKLHQRRLLKMNMEGLSVFLQSTLEKDFLYDDDFVIGQLQVCQEELRKAKMDVPPLPNERPSVPFGLEIQPSIKEITGRLRRHEIADQHVMQNERHSSAVDSHMIVPSSNVRFVIPDSLNSTDGGDSWCPVSGVSCVQHAQISAGIDTPAALPKSFCMANECELAENVGTGMFPGTQSSGSVKSEYDNVNGNVPDVAVPITGSSALFISSNVGQQNAFDKHPAVDALSMAGEDKNLVHSAVNDKQSVFMSTIRTGGLASRHTNSRNKSVGAIRFNGRPIRSPLGDVDVTGGHYQRRNDMFVKHERQNGSAVERLAPGASVHLTTSKSFPLHMMDTGSTFL